MARRRRASMPSIVMRGSLRRCRASSCSPPRSTPPPAKSSNARSATRMMCSAMKLRAFARAVFRVLEAALPFQHRPAREVVRRHLGEDRREVDLPVAQRAEAPGAVQPRLEAAVHALLAGRVELGVLDVEDLDALVVVVDVVQVVRAAAARSGSGRTAGRRACGCPRARGTSRRSRRRAGLRRGGSRSRRPRPRRRRHRGSAASAWPVRRRRSRSGPAGRGGHEYR